MACSFLRNHRDPAALGQPKRCQSLPSQISSFSFILSGFFSPGFADYLSRSPTIIRINRKQNSLPQRKPNPWPMVRNFRRHRNTLILTGKRDPKTPGEKTQKNYRIFCLYDCKCPKLLSHNSFSACSHTVTVSVRQYDLEDPHSSFRTRSEERL